MVLAWMGLHRARSWPMAAPERMSRSTSTRSPLRQSALTGGHTRTRAPPQRRTPPADPLSGGGAQPAETAFADAARGSAEAAMSLTQGQKPPRRLVEVRGLAAYFLAGRVALCSSRAFLRAASISSRFFSRASMSGDRVRSLA